MPWMAVETELVAGGSEAEIQSIPYRFGITAPFPISLAGAPR